MNDPFPSSDHPDESESSRSDSGGGDLAQTILRVRARLRSQASLFDDPGSYQAGLEDAFDAVIGVVEDPDGDPVSVEVIGEGQTHEETVSWLAAYALGLVYSDNDEQACISGLLAAAERDRELLAAARDRLSDADMPEIAVDARRLLDRALERPLTSDRPDVTSSG